jgi:hypothetical protein
MQPHTRMEPNSPKTLLQWLIAIPSFRTVIVTVIVTAVIAALILSHLELRF